MKLTDTKRLGEYLKLVAKLAWAKTTGNIPRVTELINELRMYEYDPRWSEAVEEYLKFKEQAGTIPYVRYQNLGDFVIPIENNLKIAFIADWGTGAQDAEFLLVQVMRHKPDILIHLGDIYYSGTMDEVQNNFYNIIQKRVDLEQTRIYTLAGNHDMYSGGEGYYWLLKQLKQPSSYFCLRNDYWQFLAMDTGLNDSNPLASDSKVTYLDPREADWHFDKFKNAGDRKTILLSHHQLFSDLGVGTDDQGRKIAFNPHLYQTFQHTFEQIELWLWGHEHNLVVYDPYMNLKRGRCIGASAFPVMEQEKPYQTALNFNLQGMNTSPTLNDQIVLGVNSDGFYNHAYAIMLLEGMNAKVDYYQVDSIDDINSSNLLYTDELSVK